MEYSKKPELWKSKRVMRTCLKCDRKFVAEGRFNRICGRCTESNRQIIFGHYIMRNKKARDYYSNLSWMPFFHRKQSAKNHLCSFGKDLYPAETI